MKNIIIVGAGGFGRELLQWIKDINKVENKWIIKGFIDDNLNSLNGFDCDYKVFSTIKDYHPEKNDELALAIANPEIKESITRFLKNKGAKFTSVIHPKAFISDFAEVGEGLIMYPNSGINVNTKIGDFVTILSSGIGHDVIIGDFTTISSYCDITGGVVLEKGVFLGSHTTIVPKRKIGTGAYIAAGSVVMTNIKAGYHVMGNPAKRIDF